MQPLSFSSVLSGNCHQALGDVCIQDCHNSKELFPGGMQLGLCIIIIHTKLHLSLYM